MNGSSINHGMMKNLTIFKSKKASSNAVVTGYKPK
jgi:hypothetical protein